MTSGWIQSKWNTFIRFMVISEFQAKNSTKIYIHLNNHHNKYKKNQNKKSINYILLNFLSTVFLVLCHHNVMYS